jgi:CheY-like chemotaxis protein
LGLWTARYLLDNKLSMTASSARERAMRQHCGSRVGTAFFPLQAKEHNMSDEARTVLVVTDDPSFSAMISELMLRASVQMIRFARTADALELARHCMPDLVLIHMPRGCLDTGWECYHAIQSEPKLSSIPILLYASPLVLAERAVGGRTESQVVDRPAVSDMLVGQIGPLLGLASSSWQRAGTAPAEFSFPRGRDDM